MKSSTLTIIATLFLIVYATVAPIIVTNYINSHKEEAVDYTTHYAKGDSINYEVINLVNAEIYEEQQ